MPLINVLDRPGKMTDEEKKMHAFEEEVLSLIDIQEFTRSDLQGVVGALVKKIFNAGKKSVT